MLLILSPAKRLDFDTVPLLGRHSEPAFLKEAGMLARRARRLKPADLQQLMDISEPLAEMNVRRFKDFSPPFDLSNAKQAIFAFRGDVYQGLDADSLSEADLDHAQQHLRILSGLYGLLRPLDLIQAYRLEMGTKFENRRGPDLYSFWRKDLTKALRLELAGRPLVNLASNEYFAAVDPGGLKAPVISPAFYELRDGVPKMLSFFAKRARGMMARFAIENRIDTPEGLRDFNLDGYRFRADLTNGDRWVFTRPDSRQNAA